MKKTYLFLTNGFEEIEATATIDVLRRADIDVTTVSMEEDLMVKGSHAVCIKADTLFDDNNYADSDMLILPGGTVRLMEFQHLNDLLTKQNNSNRLIAAICAAPSILGKLGILEGKEATCYPSFEKYLSGATFIDSRVVVSKNIITGKGPGCTIEFALMLVEILLGKEKSKEIATDLIA